MIDSRALLLASVQAVFFLLLAACKSSSSTESEIEELEKRWEAAATTEVGSERDESLKKDMEIAADVDPIKCDHTKLLRSSPRTELVKKIRSMIEKKDIEALKKHQERMKALCEKASGVQGAMCGELICVVGRFLSTQ